MTTFKTFAIAAMMVIGTATGFANNHGSHNPSFNHPAPAPRPVVVVHKNAHRHECHCRECEAIRYRMEMERLHRVTRGPVRGCHCRKCEDMRHHMAHPVPAPHGHGNHR